MPAPNGYAPCMDPNPIRRRWRAAETALGTFVFSADPASVEIAAGAGLDFAVIDLEHAPLQIGHAAEHIRAASGAGIAALVRVPHASHGAVGPLLDAGAHGILLAHFGRDEAQAKAFGRMLRYAPDGDRPSCTGVRAAGYGLRDFTATVTHANADIIGIGLVEDAEVIQRLDALLAQVRIDAVMPGPGDLSTSMGLHGQPTHPRVRQAVGEVISAARRAGLRAGMYLNSPGEVREWAPLNLDFYIYLFDTKLLAQAYAAAAAQIRAALS